jgi:hypothetical protein
MTNIERVTKERRKNEKTGEVKRNRKYKQKDRKKK